jgi:hypothetical protein
MTAVCTQVLTNNSGFQSSTRALAEVMTRFETPPEQMQFIQYFQRFLYQIQRSSIPEYF